MNTTRFALGDTVVLRDDTQWTGQIMGVGHGEVAVLWDHQPDAGNIWVNADAIVHHA